MLLTVYHLVDERGISDFNWAENVVDEGPSSVYKHPWINW
jgi:hypothetical protein